MNNQAIIDEEIKALGIDPTATELCWIKHFYFLGQLKERRKQLDEQHERLGKIGNKIEEIDKERDK